MLDYKIINRIVANRYLFAFFLVLMFCSSCKKYLAEKSDAKLTTISTLQDLQLILDNYSNISNNYPYTGEVVADDYYLTTSDWSSLANPFDRNEYIWQKDDADQRAYESAYSAIEKSNVVLDNLKTISYSSSELKTFENIKGSALFFRAAYLYSLSQLYCKPYDKNTASQDLGIALRLTSDYNVRSTRSTVQQTYDQIIADLKQAITLLPVSTDIKTRPSKPAAYGWLARTYLAMNEFEKAGLYADSSLRLYNSLLDYNDLNLFAVAPVPRFNKEVVLQLRSPNTDPLLIFKAKIDSTLYKSYSSDDLRKYLFFKDNGNGTYAFKGDYDGIGSFTGYVFAGIVTDEIYLIRAEAYARLGNVSAALNDINTLLITRWKTGTYVPISSTNSADVLKVILNERRKELLFRGIRWTDLRRLMNSQQFSTTPRRYINNQLYELSPNSPRYVLQIPKTVIEKTGMQQNP